MTDLTQEIDRGSQESNEREYAISAFVYLGEKLKSFYRGEKQKLQKDVEAMQESAHADAMLHTIEGEIIPRLMMIHKAESAEDGGVSPLGAVPTKSEKKRFLKAILDKSTIASAQCIDALIARGVSRESIFLDLLGETAKELGILWEEDKCDFTDVTIGLCRLHEIVRQQSLIYQMDVGVIDNAAPSVLLTNAREDQHIFGLVIVAEFFRKAGWQVRGEPAAGHDDVVSILQNHQFDVLGLSVANDPDEAGLARDICDYRAASCNTDIKILVGGRFFLQSPEMVAAIGADAMAEDAATAPEACEKMLVTRSLHC